jgi:hypothetical protein
MADILKESMEETAKRYKKEWLKRCEEIKKNSH